MGTTLGLPVVARVRIRTVLAAFAGLAIGAALGAAPAAAQEPEGVWNATSPLGVPRFDHTTTLLTSGRVLAAGGRVAVPGALLSSAEVFDPRREEWLPTGAMADARWSHTATLLRDGRVLVAGGFGEPSNGGANAQPVLDTAELYDPLTGAWTPAGSMSTRRALHAAALLPDGKVLVAGGRTCDQPPPVACNFEHRTATTEVFDPATGTWTPTGSLGENRHTTSAAVLGSGKVLIPAGFSSAGNSNTADLYDPATGTSSLTGNLVDGRARQGAMLLHDGRVLVSNGFDGNGTAELYDPTTGTWSLTGAPLLFTRFNFKFAVLPTGKALVAGGATTGSQTRTAELFDPAAGAWAPAAEMLDEHSSSSSLSNSTPAVVLASNPWSFEARPNVCGKVCGTVLLAGNNPTGSAELYTPACGPTELRPPNKVACVADDGPGKRRHGSPGKGGGKKP